MVGMASAGKDTEGSQFLLCRVTIPILTEDIPCSQK
jgi:cyclophilin family peptidyl-prolyl cis-trans isomerase